MGGRRHKGRVWAIVAVVSSALALALAPSLLRPRAAPKPKGGSPTTEPPARPASSPPQPIVSSTALQNAVVVPTLDTPVPSGRSAVWCVALPLAWKRVRQDLLKGPIQVQGASVVCRRLNASPSTEQDLDPGSVYTAAGHVRDGVVERIRSEMTARFPAVPVPSFDAPASAFLAFAYLSLRVRFEPPYLENDTSLMFRDAGGGTTPVASFGLQESDADQHYDLRSRARVLFHVARGGSSPGEFAVDPDEESRPYRIVVAAVPRQATLAAAVARVRRLEAGHTGSRRLEGADVLLIPSQSWQIDHRFSELGGALLNPGFEGLPLEARQSVRFRLDRSGAELDAEAKVILLGASAPGRSFVFDRPHLVFLEKRGAASPVFAMWVATAELLESRSGPGGKAAE